MKKGFTVKVKDSHSLSFPEYCVVCGRPYHGQLGKIELDPSSTSSMVTPIWMGRGIDKISSKKHVLSIPGHQSCIKSIRKAFWIRNLFYVLIAISVLIIGIKQGLNKFYMILLATVIALPIVLWEFSHPLPINYNHRNGEYIFEFKDRDYAERFALLNNAKVEEL
jgi:hypothetical protein